MAHYVPRTQEEEDRALAVAMQASLNMAPSTSNGTAAARASAHQYKPYPVVPQQYAAVPPYSQPGRPAYPQPGLQNAYQQAPRQACQQPTYPQPTYQQPAQTARAPAPAPAKGPAPTPTRGSLAAAASSLGAAAVQALSSGPSCTACGRGFGFGPAVQALGKTWHPGCLKCKGCNQSVVQGNTASFQVGKDEHPYHAECYKRLFIPKCVICGNHMTADAQGLIQYKESSFWHEKYCRHHNLEASGTRCTSCSRHRPMGEEWVHMGTAEDGHHLCLCCVSSIVVDTKDAQPLYDEILGFYKNLGMPLPSRPPLLLVDGKTLKDFCGKEGRESFGGPIFHVRGLCLATVHRSIPSIMRTVGSGIGVKTVTTPIAGAAETVKCSVSAILIYYGFPRLLTGSIIAHELLHAYLRLRHIPKVDPQVEEGLAQLMAYLWLDQEYGKLEGKPEEQRLCSYFSYQIREDQSKVYGEGFRTAYDAYQRGGGGGRGLVTVLNNVIRNGRIY